MSGSYVVNSNFQVGHILNDSGYKFSTYFLGIEYSIAIIYFSNPKGLDRWSTFEIYGFAFSKYHIRDLLSAINFWLNTKLLSVCIRPSAMLVNDGFISYLSQISRGFA